MNPNVRAALPATATLADAPTDERPAEDVGTPGGGFTGGLTAMGLSIGSIFQDGAAFMGAETDENGNVQAGIDPLGVAGFGTVTVGPTAILAAANRTNPLTGAQTPYMESFGTTAANTALKVTPTLVSAIAGPAIADGITMIAPNLVKKYKDTKNIKVAEEKKQAEKDNQYAKISRGVAGAVAVGLAAGAVFLLKPELFQKFKFNGIDNVIEGSTKFAVDGGKAIKLAGVLDDAAIRNTMTAIGRPIASDSAISILKTVSPIAKDAVFSNRLLMAGAGGAGTLMLANAAAGTEDPDRKKLLWGLTAAAGAATVGATYGIGKLTQRSALAANGTGGLLARNELFFKPNVEWIKKYATTIAPVTAIPAYTSASTYFNIFNDFDEITSTRSPFRK
ncbi:MAG: hypothetical protein KDC46_03275 [Thermoleophilia bacterium]|nr:hypothetical protein [Thermoleophilia bacterium]